MSHKNTCTRVTMCFDRPYLIPSFVPGEQLSAMQDKTLGGMVVISCSFHAAVGMTLTKGKLLDGKCCGQ